MQFRPYVQRALPDIFARFEDNYGRPLRKPYYMRQVQVLHEKEYFPWIVTNALGQLVDLGKLSRIDQIISGNRNISFFINSKINKPGYQTRLNTRLDSIGSLVTAYSASTVTKHLGKHLETLVFMELRAQGFKIISKNTNRYNGKKWTRTNHDLDFIAEHDSGNLNIGVEVKNQLGIMSKKLLTTKLEICKYLDLTPVMAVRWIKPYIELIRTSYDGFAWMFKTQIFPFTYEDFVKNLYKKLELPVSVNSVLPVNTIRVFEKWLNRVI